MLKSLFIKLADMEEIGIHYLLKAPSHCVNMLFDYLLKQ